MRTVSLGTVVNAVARRLGWKPDSDDGLSKVQRLEIIGWINDRAWAAWENAWWTDLDVVESRAVLTDAETSVRYVPLKDETDWDGTTTYAVGVRVRSTTNGLSYVALLASTNKDPTTETTYWEASAAHLEIGAIRPRGVSTSDPRISSTTENWPFSVFETGLVMLDSDTPDTVFVRFRRRFEEYEGTDWDDTVAYAAGDKVYRSGESYLALNDSTDTDPATDTSELKWRMIPFLAVLKAGVVEQAASDGLTGDDVDVKADRWEAQGEEKLADAMLRDQAMQGQNFRAEWKE